MPGRHLFSARGCPFSLSSLVLFSAMSIPRYRSSASVVSLLARFGRIWPAHVAAIVLVFTLLPPAYRGLAQGEAVQTTLAQLFLVHAWLPFQRFYYSLNDVSWSISTELGFYICFLLLIQAWEQTWKIKLALTALLVGSLAVFANAYYGSSGGVVAGELLVGLMYIHPLGRLFEFTLGMAAALAWRHLSRKPTIGPGAGTMLETGGDCSGCVADVFQPQLGRGRQSGYADRPSGFAVADARWYIYIGFALLVVVMALELGLVARLLAASLAGALGRRSATRCTWCIRF